MAAESAIVLAVIEPTTHGADAVTGEGPSPHRAGRLVRNSYGVTWAR